MPKRNDSDANSDTSTSNKRARQLTNRTEQQQQVVVEMRGKLTFYSEATGYVRDTYFNTHTGRLLRCLGEEFQGNCTYSWTGEKQADNCEYAEYRIAARKEFTAQVLKFLRKFYKDHFGDACPTLCSWRELSV